MNIGSFDRYASVIFAIIGAAFLLESRHIATSAYGSEVGPNVFPFLLGLILILLSVKLFLESFKSITTKNKNKEKLMFKRFLIILTASILYAAVLEIIGYLISTFLFLFISFQTMEKSGWIKNLCIAAAFSFCVYYLFVVVLKGSLPGLPIWFS
ncbi:tripartite tricarboxylate transporter TctB family protein [Fictibacillus phosphorivorans]|uniref:tripartite tricarboxylate transporter TctB family protein n=1 Tax=Fictibacillus phosphorivorans TaxID=1221500 RepID=UPI0020405756|nr:tripartite tricarboxylate transporter TctB family protein [Fictibacillus phosphorivorans]MCM3719365.1 tripartite tricarboxylate transporter TctB family protein [Fictibacillus phosphorivorans]MCM3776986.1 tripartite tricarboxylate transporter TctB family protein [Fictibacillus phosphorivorans]